MSICLFPIVLCVHLQDCLILAVSPSVCFPASFMSISCTVFSWLYVHLPVSLCPLYPAPGLSYIGFYVHLPDCLFMAVCPSLSLYPSYPAPGLSYVGFMSICLYPYALYIHPLDTILFWLYVHLLKYFLPNLRLFPRQAIWPMSASCMQTSLR